MKTRQFYRIAGSWIVLFALILLATPAIRAAEGVIPANVTIAGAPVSVEGVDPLEFGVLTLPSTSEAGWILYPLDGLLQLYVGDVTSTDLIPNDHHRGRFRISGTAGLSVNFTVEVTTDFADPQLSLLSVGPDQDTPQILDMNGQLELYIGGLLSISPGAAAGVHGDAVITMVANY